MAFSPQTGLVYLPAQDVPFYYSTATTYKYRPGAWNIAVDAYKNAPPNDPEKTKAIRALLKGALIAWNPVTQKEVWRAQYDGPWNGGALATAGGWCSRVTATARSRRSTPPRGRSCGNSRRRPA